MGRRHFLTTVAACGAIASMPMTSKAFEPHKGRLKQAVCGGVFSGLKISFEDQCKELARLGLYGVDLVGPDAFPTLKKYGLIPTMVPGGSGIGEGINNTKYHAEIDKRMRDAINAAADVGAPNVIVLAGDRKGLTDDQGAENCITFLNNIKKLAEDRNVTLCMELLNSKVNHPGYMCDATSWGVKVCKAVNSPKVKLLFDIYHMQIMEGDIIRTIRNNFQYLGHFHTAGNPGRHEFDETQELNYKAIAKAIADLGYTGYFSHEYSPTKEPIATLEKMIQICEA